MRKKILLTGLTLITLIGVNVVYAMTEQTSTVSSVTSIALSGEGSSIKWATVGNSTQGFKVVWSKNANPTYPTREGDQYHYYAEPSKSSDTLTAFSGTGTYFVRVCQYLGGKCGVYSNEISVNLTGESKESPVACTMEYAPVCGEKQVQCIKAPCPPIKQTYGNKCQLNAAKATYLYSGECKKEAVKEDQKTIEYYKKQIKFLERDIAAYKKTIKKQKQEISYLRGLLDNQNAE